MKVMIIVKVTFKLLFVTQHSKKLLTNQKRKECISVPHGLYFTHTVCVSQEWGESCPCMQAGPPYCQDSMILKRMSLLFFLKTLLAAKTNIR